MNYKNVLAISKCFILSVLILHLSGCILYSTKSTEVGVRTKKIVLFGDKGVENKIYPPGSTFFFSPFINDWHTFDTNIQNIEMTLNETRGDVIGRDDLLFKTVDGNDISLDIIISYRIIPQKAPHILQYVAANDEELRNKVVRVITRSRPRDTFGELRTEEFYNAASRSEKSNEARQILNAILAPYGVVIERILTKDYRFNRSYQKAIEDKKIADQKTEQNKSATKAKVEEYNRKLEETRGDVNILVAKVDGKYEQETIKADAYYEQQKMIAKAIRTEGALEARGIRKLNQALAGTGGDTMVKLKIANALKDKRIVLLPSGSGFDIKSTDINQLLQVYGAKKIATPISQKKAEKK